MSCRGRSRKLHSYTWKELETVRAAPELLGAPAIDGGSARPGGGGRGCHKSQISLPSRPEGTTNGRFPLRNFF
jgi:hypothetical protein